MAEAISEATPRGILLLLLNDAHWEADELREEPRNYVAFHLGDVESGVLSVDETGFLRKVRKV